MPSDPAIFYKVNKLVTLDIALDKNRMKEVFSEIASTQSDRKNLTWGVIGKVYKPSRGEPVFENMQKLWELGFSYDSDDNISIPKPIHFSSELHVLFQDEVSGEQLKKLIKEKEDPGLMRRLARTIAKLHNSGLVPGEPMRFEDHMMRCHPRYPFLGLAMPEIEEKVDHIVTSAKQIFDRFSGIRLGPIHGDLHLGQLHLDGNHIWLIDFDALAYADPAADLGNLVVFLKGKARKNPEMQRMLDAFLDEYFSIMDPAIAKRIPLYEGITHVRRACKCLRNQKKGWERKVTKMVTRGLECIGKLEATV